MFSFDENDGSFLLRDVKSKFSIGVVWITLVVTVVKGVKDELKMFVAHIASMDDITAHIAIVGTRLTSRKPGGGEGCVHHALAILDSS